jgi:hypothetical protein
MQSATEAVACQQCGSALSPESACPRCGRGQSRGSTRLSTNSFLAWTILAIILVVGLLVTTPFAYLNVRLLRSEAYQSSLKMALSSVDVQSAIGSGIQVKQPTLGHLFPFGDSQFAEWSVALAGSRGRGVLYGVANQVNGTWDFSRLVFKSENGEAAVDLTPVRALLLPSVPTKTVYLVPIGLAEGESLQWAAA